MASTVPKLDLRFCDEEDAADIVDLVNEGYSKESSAEQGGTMCYRAEGSAKVSLEQVIEDCSSNAKRWIVLETPVPEEIVVAAARLHLSMLEGRRGVVDLICACGGPNQTDLCNQLLARVEGIARGQGIEVLVVETTQWRDDMQTWLESCGYVDRSGRASSEAGLIKPTAILEYQKDLRATTAALGSSSSSSSSEAVASTAAAADLLSRLELEDDVFEFDTLEVGAAESGGGRGGDTMEALISSLFVALHKEEGEEKN